MHLSHSFNYNRQCSCGISEIEYMLTKNMSLDEARSFFIKEGEKMFGLFTGTTDIYR